MLIGGLQKFSIIDYPGKVCAIIFTVSCNFKCPYCHNPELITGEGCQFWEKSDIFKFLESRVGKLDAVTITGGEPTLHKDLQEFIKEIRDMGFLIKLDSNGTNPRMLKKILDAGLVDYVAMDIKAPEERYSEVVGATVDFRKISESISLIMEYAPDYEFRTTTVRSQISKEDFHNIGKMIEGSKRYYIQKFIPTKTLDESFMNETSYSEKEFESIRESMLVYVEECKIR